MPQAVHTDSPFQQGSPPNQSQPAPVSKPVFQPETNPEWTAPEQSIIQELPTPRPEWTVEQPATVPPPAFEGVESYIVGISSPPGPSCSTNAAATERSLNGWDMVRTAGPFGSCQMGVGTVLIVIVLLALIYLTIRSGGAQDAIQE